MKKAHPRRILFSDEKIEQIKPRNNQFEYWDKKYPGFGIRITPSGRKSWVGLTRFNGKLKRVTLGTFPKIKTEMARIAANKIFVKAFKQTMEGKV